jgi:hypothetical protein
MGLLDAIFGRQRPTRPSEERLFAISTAELTLQTSLQLQAGNTAGICFQAVASSPFKQIQADLNQLMQVNAQGGAITARPYQDSLGYKWILLESTDFQALVATIHMASQTLLEQGYGEQLLAAVFRFNDEDGYPVYWIYNYKRGKFYPFVPRPDSHSHQRDNAEELHLSAAMDKELPLEAELERWYAMWDLPF